MNKFFHRGLTTIVTMSIFAVFIVSLSRHGFPLFLSFLIATTISITMAVFLQKIPMKCDQDECNGIAALEYKPEINNKILKQLLIKGHKCNTCGHLIKPPKQNNS